MGKVNTAEDTGVPELALRGIGVTEFHGELVGL